MPSLLTLLPFAFYVSSSTFAFARSPPGYACKCAPFEPCWPSRNEWAALNRTVDGKLLMVIPTGAVCYQGGFEGINTYDAAKCANVTAMWPGEQWQTDQQVTNLWTLWTNIACDPAPPPPPGSPPGAPTPLPTPDCTIGFLPRFVILATKPSHIQTGVHFARQHNIRLVIRNTGHDFMGRSTGWGSLAINTHSFKSVKFAKRWTGPSEDGWRGGAVKVGSGIQTRELYRKAFEQSPKVVVVGGECPTVGISGGYVQGGGHGPLATIHGMGADNVLEFEVVTADGVLRTANSHSNPSLFWALRGGGPSTFGAVVSVTLKTFPEIRSAALSLDLSPNVTSDQLWNTVSAFHKRANDYVDKGMFVYWELFFNIFRIHPFVAPGMTKTQLSNFLRPFLRELDKLGVPYNTTVNDYPTFFELYTNIFEDEGAGVAALSGGRIMTHRDIRENSSAIIDAYKLVLNPPPPYNTQFGGIIGHIVGPGHGKPRVNNAINPVWRDASSFSIFTVGASTDPATQGVTQELVTDVWGEAFREAAPHGGAYVNEGDLEEPNWQHEYWGTNYPRLLKLKKEWDPADVFYARTTPGTENWEVIQGGTRLCKKL